MVVLSGSMGSHRSLADRLRSGWDTAAQIAVFLWMALVLALFGVVAAGFLLA